ncbi:MAG: hypothetical protein GY832_11270 [Chloroflexi bacterium]|nr:hypothetical protein [Chloroflexota bacterium]
MTITMIRATTKIERDAINTFLVRHNVRGSGSTRGYVAYYAAIDEADGPLLDRIVAVAKICPLHTPQAAKFFAGDDWRHVYCLQRLAAHRAPTNLLSQFVAWCLRECAKDDRIHWVATYADTGTRNTETGRPHDGGIYRATNAVYAGLTRGGRVEGFIQDGQRHSMRCGPKTHTVSGLNSINTQARLVGKPDPIKMIRSSPMHRYCWAIGATRRERRRRLRILKRRMARFQFVPMYQPRLLAVIKSIWIQLRRRNYAIYTHYQ